MLVTQHINSFILKISEYRSYVHDFYYFCTIDNYTYIHRECTNNKVQIMRVMGLQCTLYQYFFFNVINLELKFNFL